MSGKNVFMTGTTGMIGRLVLGLCLERDDVEQVTSITHVGCGLRHQKLFEIVYKDHQDYPAITRSLEGQDVGLFCLANYKGILPEEELRKLATEYVYTLVEALHQKSPKANISLLSVRGADPKSKFAFARFKGLAEKALKEKGFGRVDTFRPAYIYPVKPRKDLSNWYRFVRLIYPVVKLIYPNFGVTSDQLARVMVETALKETVGRRFRVFDNQAIRAYQ